MNKPDPTIRVNVTPTNPGQFFACCGLLELADRLWAGAKGWFEIDENAFCLRPTRPDLRADPSQLIQRIGRCELKNTMTARQFQRFNELSAMTKKERERTGGLEDEKKGYEKLWRESPLVLGPPFNLLLDWFLDDRSGGARFKTWAGQQSVIDIALAMKRPIEAEIWNAMPPDRWLVQSTDDDSVPFNFDSDLSGQASDRDAGFSFDPLGINVTIRPLLELAAFIGLQRFRPAEDDASGRYIVCCWSRPLPPEVACVASRGTLASGRLYAFRLLYRTKYLKSFLPANLIGDLR